MPKMDYLDLNTMQPSNKNIMDFDDSVLNYSLKSTVCLIFFNMRNEPQFFKQNKVIVSLINFNILCIGRNKNDCRLCFETKRTSKL